jgi:hypothetical protein
MELDEVKRKLKAANLHPICLKGSPLENYDGSEVFVGNFDEYIEATRILGVAAIFIHTEMLTEDRFVIELEANEDSDDEVDEIDICKFNPKLKKYRDHVGQIGVIQLSIPSKFNVIFFIPADWWDDFIELYNETAEQINEDREDARTQVRAKEIERNRDILKSLSNLIRDQRFVKLPTQRAMLEYAKEHVAELETIDERILRREMQNLHAKIKAKGL